MKLKKYLPIIGILIFVYILFRLDVLNVWKEILEIKTTYLLLALFFVFASFFTETLKWFAIAKTQMTNVPFFDAFKINLITMFYGFITPSRIGGVIRAEYLKKYNQNFGKGASNYVLDKVLDLCSVIFLAIVFSFVFKDIIPINFFYYAILIFILLVGLLIFFIDKKRSKSILRIFYKKLVPEKIKEKAKNGFNSFYEDMPRKRFFLLFFILNLLNWITLYFISFFVGLSLGMNVPFFYFLAILPIATLIGQLPITISGLGTREATLISLFGLLGVEATKVFSMSLISLVVSGIIPTLIGSFLIFKYKMDK